MSKLLKDARVPEPSLRFTLECWAEITETMVKKGSEDKKVGVVFKVLCNDTQPANNKTASFSLELSDNAAFVFYCHLEDAFRNAAEALPELLAQKCADAIFHDGIRKAVRDDDYVPPRNRGDWSQEKLRRAVIRAVTEVPKFSNPTLKKAAERITRRYSLAPPLTADALRMLLKRYELDWWELKKWQPGRK